MPLNKETEPKQIPLNYILENVRGRGCKFPKSQEKINHLIYIDDIKLFAKNEKELETLIHTVRIYSQDLGMAQKKVPYT